MAHGVGVVRLIPARAGNTSLQRPTEKEATAHPRSRGEHAIGLGSHSALDGSSPLARGALFLDHQEPPSCRLIPARAGSITTATPPPAQALAHPRSRGEHVLCLADEPGGGGSSPLARGTPLRRRSNSTGYRLIPARAGNTTPSNGTPPPGAAHPRSRGEHKATMLVAAAHTGSSPLARGTRGRDPRRQMRNRLIPARAGNTKAPGT